MANNFQSFVGKFTPSSNLIKPSEKTIKKYKNILPEDLMDFWMEYGFGNYGNGLVKIIDPSAYENAVGINKECDVPLLVGSFGDIFIYRTIPAKNLKAIGILNVHFR
ncbi:MAG: hypothetical protein FWD94_07080, partial [Treponema sp.]|nr:hypothetical protein [Treponema sp.]